MACNATHIFDDYPLRGFAGDRRGSLPFGLQPRLGLQAVEADHRPLGPVLDISADGLALRSGRQTQPPDQVVLGYRGAFSAPNPVRPQGRRGDVLALSFVQRDPLFLGQVSSYLFDIHQEVRLRRGGNGGDGSVDSVVWEVIDDRKMVQLFCRTLSLCHVRGRVESPLGQVYGEARLHRGRLRPAGITLEWEWLADPPTLLPLVITFEGHGAVYRLWVEDLNHKNGRVVTVGPARVERKQQRRYPRTDPVEQVRLTFDHPLVPGRMVHKTVTDLSYRGVGFEVDVVNDLLFPDLVIPQLSVTLPTGETLQVRGRVCHNFEKRRGDQVYCGLELKLPATDERRTWHGLVEQLILPQVARADWPALNGIWDHYTGAGYFSLSGKTPQDFADAEAPFVEIWSRINGTEGAGRLAVWKHNNEVVGSLTASRIYAPTMLIQGLATRSLANEKTPGRGSISRDLYFYVFHHALHDPSVRYILAYLCMSSARRWHQVLCEQYADHKPDQAYSYLFRLMEAPNLFGGIAPRPGSSSPAIQVEPATDADCAWLCAETERESPLLADALDFKKERMDLAQVNGILGAAGLFRKRVILTARFCGERLAVAVVEAGNDHLNPYNLFDSVRLVSVPDEHPQKEEACTQLLMEAQKLLASMGKTQCVLFAHDDHVPAAGLAGFRVLDEVLCWVINRKGFASYLSHIFEIIAPD